MTISDDQAQPRFKVYVRKRFKKRFKQLPAKHQGQIRRRLKELESNPRPADSIKLKALSGYRIDEGEYRILYEVDWEQKTVDVYRLLHRNEGYPLDA